ncbi:MAG: histidine phosphatase family protein, partial [Bacteroidota bacterium]
MKTKTIYLLRHGQTDYNKNGLVQGRGVDASLNDVGRKQATAASNHFKGLPIDRFFSSSLIRTHETLAPFGVDFTPLEGFDEISWGAFEGLETTPDDKNLYRATINGWRTGLLDAAIGGGESPRDVKARQEEAMKQVLEDESETILICMHGRAMRILLCWLLSYPLNYMDGFPHQ